jgi:hypothetical protein
MKMFCLHCNEELFDRDFKTGIAILQEHYNLLTDDPYDDPTLTETHLKCFVRVEGGDVNYVETTERI